jgi:hypothetical protein
MNEITFPFEEAISLKSGKKIGKERPFPSPRVTSTS